MKQNLFIIFWSQYRNRPLEDRAQYFNSLSTTEKTRLLQSFFNGGWHEFFVQNHIEHLLDVFKRKYCIDLIEMRIQALKNNKTFLIKRVVWERIEEKILEWEEYYNIDIVFGGLQVCTWGRNKQFCKIRRAKELY